MVSDSFSPFPEDHKIEWRREDIVDKLCGLSPPYLDILLMQMKGEPQEQIAERARRHGIRLQNVDHKVSWLLAQIDGGLYYRLVPTLIQGHDDGLFADLEHRRRVEEQADYFAWLRQQNDFIGLVGDLTQALNRKKAEARPATRGAA